MKKFQYLIWACMSIFFSGCVDEQLETEPVVPPVSGDEVFFGANPGEFSIPETKTVYGLPDGETYDNYTSLEIDWIPDDDKVRVYCDQTSECQTADYAVKLQDSKYYLQKIGDIGVRWGNDLTKNHNFYAFYPLDKITNGLENGTEVTVTIPVAQEHGELLQGEEDGITDPNWLIIKPDMSYALMSGHAEWIPGNDKNVAMTFTPIVTVLDVVVTASGSGTSDKISTISVRSKSQPIVGTFTYDVKENKITEMPASGEDTNIATVDCTDDNGNPIEISGSQKLNVKFFLLPNDIDASELSVSVMLENGVVLTQALVPDASTPSNQDPLIKGQIIKVKTPKILTGQPSNWMSLIDDDVLFASQLSIPGTIYSYTYTQYESERNNYVPETQIMTTYQTLDIGQQFDAGIRAFDIKINTGGRNNPRNEARIYVNGVDLQENGEYQTLGDMLDLLKSKLDKAPTEFVIVSINWVDNGRTADQWVDDINDSVEEWSNRNQREDDGSDGTDLNNDDIDYFRDVTSSTKAGAMRHGIGIMIHAPETYTGNGVSNSYLNIMNYNSGVQNTEIGDCSIENNRGNGTVYFQNLRQVNNPDLKLYPYYITENHVLHGASLDLIDTKKQLIDELFSMSRTNNASTGNRTNNLYVNDLGGFCVVNDNMSTGWADATVSECESYWLFGTRYRWNDSEISLTDYRTINNYNYRQDKDKGFLWNRPDASEGHIGEKSIEITSRKDNVDKGEGGNNALLAEYINADAADKIYNLVDEGRTPLGVVYMNFAGTDEVTFGSRTYNVSGIRLPSLIMSNNFKFSLATDETRSGN